MNLDASLKTLSHLTGPGGCRTGNVHEFAIDGIIPRAVVSPRTPEQIADIVRFAGSEDFSIIPWGGGTSIGSGNIPERYDIALSLSKFDAMLELEPEDLSCSVQAGITLGELNSILGEYNLFAAVDPPCTGTATLGGITASNQYGPLRHQYGTIKDQILGMNMVLSDGMRVKSGGKVVKNVAGYDVHKLFIGSEGTLGIITELNLRLRPVPVWKRTMFLGFATIPEAMEMADRIINSFLLPEYLVILCSGAASVVSQKTGISIPAETTGLLIGIDNHPQNVEWQSDEIRRMVEGKNLKYLSVFERDELSALRKAVRDYPETFGAELIVKINFLLSDFMQLYMKQKDLQKSLPNPARLLINPGTGVMHLIYDTINELNETQKEIYIRFLEDELRLVAEFGGEFSLERAPLWIKRKIPARGNRRRDDSLVRTIKNGLDPKNIMSPGRFNGGW